MFPVVEAAVQDGDFEKSREAILRFEKQSNSGVNKMWYTSEFGLDVFVTSQLAMSYVMDDSTMVNLHGEGGVELVERKEGEGWVNEIEGSVFVRRAKKVSNYEYHNYGRKLPKLVALDKTLKKLSSLRNSNS